MPPIPENKLKCVSIYFHPPSLPSGPGWHKPLDQAVLKITYILTSSIHNAQALPANR